MSSAESRSTRSRDGAGGGWRAASIYVGVSLVAALVFWAVTTFTGDYPAVARYGGSVWVFILFMIVLMPLVIPRVRRRRVAQAGAQNDAGAVECPLDVTNR